MLLALLALLRCIDRATYSFIGDTVGFGDLAQRFALLYAVEDIRPIFGGNAVVRLGRAGATLLAFLLKRRMPVSGMNNLSVCHGIIILDTGKGGTDGC